MSKEKFFIGLPQSFNQKFFVYPPKVKDMLEDDNFQKYRFLLTLSQEEIEDEFVKKKKRGAGNFPTPFEYLLANSYHNKEFEQVVKKAFYFFIKQDITFFYKEKKILIGNLQDLLLQKKKIEDLIFLDESEYFDFQNLIRESLGEDRIEKPNPKEHPKIRRMKALARYRDRIKKKQNKGLDFYSYLGVICCMGLGITPLNIGEMSYASLGAIISIYQDKEKYQIDISSLQAGASSKKIKPKYWIKRINE